MEDGSPERRPPEEGRRVLLVTGGEGKVGRRLSAEAARAGWRVLAPGREALDVTLAGAVRRAILGSCAAAVVHAAARTDVDGCEADPEGAFRVNAEGAGATARAAAECGSVLVHLSTDFVFAGDLPRPLREEDPVGALGVYGRSKEEGERRVRDACPGAIVLRTSWLHGGTGPDFPRKILPVLRSGRPLRVVADQTGSPTYVGDLVAAILFLLSLPTARRPRLVHFANDGAVSRFEWARALALATGSRSEILPAASVDFPGACRPAWSALDPGFYASLRGMRPRSWRETLVESIEDERGSGGALPGESPGGNT